MKMSLEIQTIIRRILEDIRVDLTDEFATVKEIMLKEIADDKHNDSSR